MGATHNCISADTFLTVLTISHTCWIVWTVSSCKINRQFFSISSFNLFFVSVFCAVHDTVENTGLYEFYFMIISISDKYNIHVLLSSLVDPPPPLEDICNGGMDRTLVGSLVYPWTIIYCRIKHKRIKVSWSPTILEVIGIKYLVC